MVRVGCEIDKAHNSRYHEADNCIAHRLMPEQRGNQIRGRIGTQCRRASFFCPSPSANPVGVEEGHLVTIVMVPFFIGVCPRFLDSWRIPKRQQCQEGRITRAPQTRTKFPGRKEIQHGHRHSRTGKCGV